MIGGAVWISRSDVGAAENHEVGRKGRARASLSKKGATFGGHGQPSGRPRPRIFSRIPGVGWSSFGLGMSLFPSSSPLFSSSFLAVRALSPRARLDLSLFLHESSKGSCQEPLPEGFAFSSARRFPRSNSLLCRQTNETHETRSRKVVDRLLHSAISCSSLVLSEMRVY